MMTLSIGRCRRLAYWPMPSARLTATRNFWLPERKATLIGRSPVARLNASRSSALARRAVAAGLAGEAEVELPAAEAVEDGVGVIDHLLLGLADEVQLQAVLAEQFAQRAVDLQLLLDLAVIGVHLLPLRLAGFRASPARSRAWTSCSSVVLATRPRLAQRRAIAAGSCRASGENFSPWASSCFDVLLQHGEVAPGVFEVAGAVVGVLAPRGGVCSPLQRVQLAHADRRRPAPARSAAAASSARR